MAFENLSNLWSDSKARVLILVAGVGILLVLSIGIMRMRESAVPTSVQGSSVSGTPRQLQDVPGLRTPSVEYQQLRYEENRQRAEAARKEGGSSVPSLLRAGEDFNQQIDKLNAATQSQDPPKRDPRVAYREQIKAQQALMSTKAQRAQQAKEQKAAAARRTAYENLMKAQMQALFRKWAPPTQAYVAGAGVGEDLTLASNTRQAAPAGSQATAVPPARLYAKAGDVLFAVLDTAVDSDEPGPVMATIVQGPLKGARVIGGLTLQHDKVLLHFSTINLPGLPRSIGVNAVAIDPDTAKTGLASSVDHHYWKRYGTLFASSYLQGLSQAITGETTTSTGTTYCIGCTNQEADTLDPNTYSSRQQTMIALGKVGEQFSSVLGDQFDTPTTVKVRAGIPLGLLILADMSADVAPQPVDAASFSVTRQQPASAAPQGQSASVSDDQRAAQLTGALLGQAVSGAG